MVFKEILLILLLGFSLFHLTYKKSFDNVRILFLLFSIVLVALFSLMRDTRLVNRNAIIIPFHSFSSIWNSNWEQHGKYVAAGLIGNILLYVPFGLLMYKYNKENIINAVLFGFFLSFGVELIQFYTKIGTFELDDIFCNTYGTQVGVVIHQYILKKRVNVKVISICALFLFVLFVCCIKAILINL